MKIKTKYNSGFLRQIILCFFAIGLIAFVSCKKETSSGIPVIKDVRITNPSAADSTFTRAFPGTMIVIQGTNLDDLKQIYFNNTLVPFNSVYATSTNIIVSIPADIPLKGTNPAMPNTIHLITGHGEVTFNFKFLSPKPTISTFQFRIPAKVDSTLQIYGTNFYEVQKVVFYRNATKDSVAVTNFTINNTYNKITVKIPAGCNVDGHITVMCESGNATDTYLAAPVPVFVSYNDDMPIFGDSVIITGKYFYALQKVIMPGGVEVLPAAVKISALADRLAFKMPAITIGGKITLQFETGTIYSDANFYDVSKVILDFDTRGSFSWGDHNTIAVADVVPPLNSSNKFLRLSGKPGAWNYWFGNADCNVAPWPTTIPDNTLLSALAIKMKVFCNSKWNEGNFEVDFGSWKDNISWYPWKTADIPTGKWVTMSIPLSSFTKLGTTWADFKGTSITDGICFFFKHDSANAAWVMDICIDDVRITFK